MDRPGFLAAARADTGAEPRRDGDRDMPFVVVLGDRVWLRDGVPFTVGFSAGEVLVEPPGVPGFRGVVDIVTGNDDAHNER